VQERHGDAAAVKDHPLAACTGADQRDLAGRLLVETIKEEDRQDGGD
jgi:hypothetical protein